MNKNSELDKWLQKNVTHSEDESDRNPKTIKTPSDKQGGSKQSKKKKKHRHKKSHKNKKRDNKRKPQKKGHQKKGSNKLRIIPLGGLNEIGKNMMAIEYGDDIVVVDMGLQFPEEDMLGVDYIVPDITYLKENQDKIRGILITHGHLDHIGAIPYLSPKLNNPKFFSLKLTLGLIKKQLKEHRLVKKTNLVEVKPLQPFRLGVFNITFFRVNHSIPDSTGIAIETPEGMVVHTGDFKFDFTPADGIPADTAFMEKLGKKGVLALCSDSTNATKEGHTMSEKIIGETLDEIITNTQGRLIIASFSSLIGRMQQVLDSAKKNKRQVYISGRSMIENVKIATKLGYLKYPKNLVKDLKRDKKAAHKDNALILTTGSQGESLSALTRMALGEHRSVKVGKNDTIVYSSSPIVGNERAVYAVVNELTRKGAKVITHKAMDVHTSGHGNREDLKLMIKKIKPKYLIPVHGEYYMRHAHSLLGQEIGVKKDNCIIADNGSIIEFKKGSGKLSKETVTSGYILVDSQMGKLSGVASRIISERQSMANNGIITPVVLISKKSGKSIRSFTESNGFVFMKQTRKIIEDMNREARSAYDTYRKKKKGKIDIEKATNFVTSQVNQKITNRIERRPLVSPIIIEV